jgi:dihydroxyacetone kinase DhaKLM complex PTS-EIIA-like component DhaM
MTHGISIVLVSHSKKIAEGLKEFLIRLSDADVVVPESEGLGTSAVAIADAINRCEGSALLICDIGSSVISAKSAIEISKRKAEIADCPFVEGAIVAAISVSSGKSLKEVKREAEKAWGMRKL